LSPPCAPSGWGGSRFRYTGQIEIPEVQLYHYKARVYDPVFGHFLQTDPVGYRSDVDLYAYVGDDPTNRADPTGQLTGGGPIPILADLEALPDLLDKASEISYGFPGGPGDAAVLSDLAVGARTLSEFVEVTLEARSAANAAVAAADARATIGPGRDFTTGQRAALLARNEVRNGGMLRSEKSRTSLISLKAITKRGYHTSECGSG
jgi:RHS repeat-associated protein